jgi:hypothetical protein
MSLFSYFTGTTPQSEQDAQLAAKEQANRDRLAARLASSSPPPADIVVQDQALENQSNESELAAAEAGFVEGAAAGLQNVLKAPGQVIGFAGDSASTLLGGILKNIPWWVYLGGAAALFVWMGGLELLRGRLGRLNR